MPRAKMAQSHRANLEIGQIRVRSNVPLCRSGEQISGGNASSAILAQDWRLPRRSRRRLNWSRSNMPLMRPLA